MDLPLDFDSHDASSFDDAELTNMKAALVAACHELDIVAPGDQHTAIAKLIVKHASKGVRDRDSLKALSVAEFRAELAWMKLSNTRFSKNSVVELC